jgi:hypothetical protein
MLYFIDFMRFSIIGISHVDPMISLAVGFGANLIIFPIAILLFRNGKRLTVL